MSCSDLSNSWGKNLVDLVCEYNTDNDMQSRRLSGDGHM